MAALVKYLLPLVLLVGVLSHLAVSASAEQVKVTFLMHQILERPGMLMIAANTYSMSRGRSMQLTRGDVWVLTVTLTKGEEYNYTVLVLPDGNSAVCKCSPNQVSEFTVPEDYESSHFVKIVSGYDCNEANCTQSEGKSMDSIRQLYANLP